MMRWGWVVGVALGAAGFLASCGDECESAVDCDFGEGCFEGECVSSAGFGQSCSLDDDCVDSGFPAATARCVAGRCQVALDPPDLSPLDAGPSDGGSGDGGMGDGGETGECHPPEPETCPSDQTCLLDGTDTPVCRPAGPNGVGEPCGVLDNCVHEAICLQLVGTPTQCWQACDADNPCTAPETCTMLQDLSFGVCQAP